MSRGPGTIEARIAELFAATTDRALSVGDICDHAYALAGRKATREQRLAATRAAHRLLRRMRQTNEAAKRLSAEAHRLAEAAVGPMPRRPKDTGGAAYKAFEAAFTAYHASYKATPAYRRAEKLRAFVEPFKLWTPFTKVGKDTYQSGEPEFWRATTVDNRTLYFHRPDVPVQLWAVDIQPAGVVWFPAEIVKIGESHVSARYAGVTGRLDRERLWLSWAWWRGCMFVSSRDGRAAMLLDEMWQQRYGHASGGVPPVMRMALAEAIALLGVPQNYTREDVMTAFRRKAKKGAYAHPDLGGTDGMFQKLVEARDRLLAAIGTSAPAPKPPKYAPEGTRVVYRVFRRSGAARIGSTRRLGRG